MCITVTKTDFDITLCNAETNNSTVKKFNREPFHVHF